MQQAAAEKREALELEKIEKMKALEIAVDFWTINDPTVAKRLQGLGADGVMTDNPKLLVDALR